MPFIDALQGEQLTIFERNARPVQFAEGDLIIQEGEPGDGCYIVDAGTIRLELQSSETDTDSVLGFLDPGEFLGELSLLDGRPRSASAFAHTPVEARWFSETSFSQICQLHPDVGLTITSALGQNVASKLRSLTDRIAGYVFAGEIDQATNEMVARAARAQATFAEWPEARVDAILTEIAESLADRADVLGLATVEETGLGVPAHKAAKIRFATLEVTKGLVGETASGLLDGVVSGPVIELASPVGVILGLIPLTNPVSTIAFKALISIKGRNALILSCHRGALGAGNAATDVVRNVLEKHGAPVDLVQSIRKRTSRRKTMMFMNHPDVTLVLATGGTSMVKAAYSSGTPAIGVGSGNAPVLICADADLPATARKVVDSKSFDNGVICGSENNLVVVERARRAFTQALEEAGAIVLSPAEKEAFTPAFFDLEHGRVRRDLIGKSAKSIALAAGVERDCEFRLIVVPLSEDEVSGPYGHEKLAPVLSLVTVRDANEGIAVAKQILRRQGRGHTAVIHTSDEALAVRYGTEVAASRILVNVGASQGCIGIGTGLTPSFTLGCGTFGGNSTTDNVTYTHLINVKRVALPT